MKPSIGVLITYYNEGELLTACLNSLLGGSELPDEILIYDDGSTLPPDAFIPPGAPVRVVRGAENHGLGFSRNRLLGESRADYVHCHDSDDLFYPTWCARVRAAIVQTSAQVVLTEMTVTDADQRPIADTVGLRGLRRNSDLTRFAILNCLNSERSTFLREIALGMGGFRTREVLERGEDCDFHIRLAHAAASFTVIHEPLYYYWLRPNSLSRGDDLTRASGLISGIRSCELLGEELPARYRDILAESAMRRAVKLYSLGFTDDGRKGRAVARRLAVARHLSLMRTAVGVLGFETSAAILRRFGALPAALRYAVRAMRPRRRAPNA